MKRSLWVFLSLLACTQRPGAPELPSYSPDAAWIGRYAQTGRFRFGEPRAAAFTPNGDHVLFLQSGPRSPEQSILRIDLTDGRVATVVGPEDLRGAAGGDAVSDAELSRRERRREVGAGIVRFEISAEGEHVIVPFGGSVFRVSIFDGAAEELALGGEGPVLDPRLSPNGAHLAFVRDDGFYVYDFASRHSRRIATASGEGASVGLAEFVALEEMGRDRGFWWAPDSRTLVIQRTDESSVETLRRPSSSDPSAPSVAQRYPRPGRENARVELFMISVWGGASTPVKWDAGAYPYLNRVEWAQNAPLTLVVQDREQRNVVVLAADSRGETRELHREADPAWVSVDPDLPVWLANGSAFLWATERDGDWQLELRTKSGELSKVLVPMSVGYRGFSGTSDAGALAVVEVGRDPTAQKVAAVTIPEGKLSYLRERNGFHQALAVGPNGSAVVRTESLTTRPMVQVLAASGERVLPSRAAEPGEVRTRLLELGGESRSYRAAVTVPPDLPAGVRVPGIFYVYGGPTSVTVEQRSSALLLDQWLSHAGFVVFRIDARGTPRRGSAWHRAIKGDLFGAPLADYQEAIPLLAEAVPALDPERIGVFGWSFGGYAAAMSVMRAPELFKAAVAGAPVIDWADYDTHYTERYLGVPEDAASDPAYRVSSVLRYADSLKRPLMLVHGTADDNVFFMHSAKLSDHLTRRGILHRLVPLTNESHRVRDPERLRGLYLSIARFFREALADPKPLALEQNDEASAVLTGLKSD